MPDVPQAPLALEAITLRGVGSYLHGARLDIRPLTILCGANGSGKSTWSFALNLLRTSLERGLLPWFLDHTDYDANSVVFTNAKVMFAEGEYLLRMNAPNADSTENFGPLGCVGVEFKATSDFCLTSAKSDKLATPIALDFLEEGNVRGGTRFRFRIAEAGHWSGGEDQMPLWRTSALSLQEPNSSEWHTIDLRWDCRLDERRTNLQTGLQEWTRPPDGDLIYLSCSRSFVSNPPSDRFGTLLGLVRRFQGDAKFVGQPRLSGPYDESLLPETSEKIVKGFETRVNELLGHLLASCFFIGAVRQPQQVESCDEFPAEMVAARRVQGNERAAWACEESFKNNPMLEPCAPEDAKRLNHCVEGFISYWCRRLVNAEIEREGQPRVVTFPASSKIGPCGFLIDIAPTSADRPVPECVKHPCFGSAGRDYAVQRAARMSAGFHQIFPIVVQIALMRKHELVSIENPEVHLHPSLQLQIAEFLIQQAKSGRRLLVETHSDLVVRRVLRAILAEEISQSQVGIYFADIEKEEHGYHYSTLMPLEINDKGQVANWPPGFMDDDVKESRRLLDTMYGREDETEKEPGE